MGEQPFPSEGFLQSLRWRWRFDDPVVTALARILEPGDFDDAETGRDILQFFRDGLANPSLDGAARAVLVRVGHVDLNPLPRQPVRHLPATGRWRGAGVGRAARPSPFQSAQR